MGDRPLVRNSIQPEDLGYGLAEHQGIGHCRRFHDIAQLGWLLAINRSGRQTAMCTEVGWKLSQYELGTREASLLSTAAAMLASHANNSALLEERETLLVSVVRALVSAVDSRDPYTCGHSERVALYARRLAQEVGLDDDACEKIYLTGLLHDLGKIGISDSVLKKCGPLTEEEFAEIEQHPDLGWAILHELEQFDYVLPGVLHHHERYDGKGYPDKLRSEEIPLEGRLLAVVDSFDAMTSDRPYRNGMPIEKAIEIFGDGAGTQWDAEMVDAFLRILPDINEIRRTYRRPPLPNRKAIQQPRPRELSAQRLDKPPMILRAQTMCSQVKNLTAQGQAEAKFLGRIYADRDRHRPADRRNPGRGGSPKIRRKPHQLSLAGGWPSHRGGYSLRETSGPTI